MRFLCLHGKGTSAKIFQSQSAAFRKLLDPSLFEFDFVDAPLDSDAAPGIDLFYPPPYYSFYDLYPTESTVLQCIEEAHEWLLDYIDTHGPYDGVMNFSQGCALTSSLLLYHQNYRPDEEPPFKVAMFICGGLPLDAAAAIGVPVSETARAIDASSKTLLSAQASSSAILAHGSKRWDPKLPLSALPLDNVFGINFENVPRERLIQIPTVHVYGAKDPRFPASVTLAHFCEPSVRRVFDHGGGHDIPKRRDVSIMMAELVEWCGMMAERW